MSTGKTILALCITACLISACGQRGVSYRRDINPILQQNCAVCHLPGGAGYGQSGFSVATYQDVMKGTRYGSVIAPGSSVSSTLVRLIKHQADGTINMPKNYTIAIRKHSSIVLPGVDARQLPARDIELIEEWVNQGARNN